MVNDDPSRPEEIPEAPEALTRALKALDNHALEVPPEVDARILAAARESVEAGKVVAADFKDPSIRRGRPFAWAAAAAVLLGLLALRVDWFSAPSDSPDLAEWLPEDINRDRKVDILDAFELARMVARHDARLTGRHDFNGDGRSDAADAEWLARAAVRLEGGSI